MIKRSAGTFTAFASAMILCGSAWAAPCSAPNSIARVTNTSIGAYEYVVFDFIKPPNLPPFSISTASPPFLEDPSGIAVHVAGNRFKKVAFSSVGWMCDIVEALHLPRSGIKGVKKTGQFEGYITYIIGRRAGSSYLGSYSYDAGPKREIVLKFSH